VAQQPPSEHQNDRRSARPHPASTRGVPRAPMRKAPTTATNPNPRVPMRRAPTTAPRPHATERHGPPRCTGARFATTIALVRRIGMM
ncbi:MAG: hypothetical protein KAI47_17090, partial [Deltaproteobacteria bacterium]|nr:hypothetical protein [Deltaproteobacteria bacterium]